MDRPSSAGEFAGVVYSLLRCQHIPATPPPDSAHAREAEAARVAAEKAEEEAQYQETIKSLENTELAEQVMLLKKLTQ